MDGFGSACDVLKEMSFENRRKAEKTIPETGK